MDSYEVEGKTVFGLAHLEAGGIRLLLPGPRGVRAYDFDRTAKLTLSAMLMNGENGKPSKLQRKAEAAERKRRFGTQSKFGPRKAS